MKGKSKYRFQIKRVYDEPSAQDGFRFLVDRLWPRGIKKEALRMDEWLKEIAPSQPLRQWFGHEPEKWNEFRRRYRAELEKNPDAWSPLLTTIHKGNVTLLFSARDLEKNQAVVLRDFLMEKISHK